MGRGRNGNGPEWESRWNYKIFNFFIRAAAALPSALLAWGKDKTIKSFPSFSHYMLCGITYQYYRKVCKYCKKAGAIFYFAEAPEESKINGLSKEQTMILQEKMSTAQLLNRSEYLKMAYCGNERCLAFAESRYKGTKLYYNGEYVKPEDHASPYYNVKDGIRYTPANQGKGYFSIHMFGSCIVRGFGVSDEYTIPNYLQEMLNQNDAELADVINHGSGGEAGYQGMIHDLKYILDTRLSQKDIVIFLSFHTYLSNLIKKDQKERYCECSQLFSNGKIKDWWFLNSTVHLNQVGNQVIASKLLEELLPLVTVDKVSENKFPKKKKILRGHNAGNKNIIRNGRELQNYLSFLKSVKAKSDGKIGAIVMNCNPFTYGHKYLIENAQKEVDHLYVFVVEEDCSYFQYSHRFLMVQKGTEEFSKVTVLPSGKFIISALTFPEYFLKEENQEIKIDASNDLEIFGNYIAPALNISVRFAGSEPYDAVTRQYNVWMASALKKYGIHFQCLERCRVDEEYVSATKVRKLIEEEQWEEIKKYVPETTMAVIQEHYRTPLASQK